MSKEIKKWDVQILLLVYTGTSDFSFFFSLQKKDIEQIIFSLGALDEIEPMSYLNPNPFHNTTPTT